MTDDAAIIAIRNSSLHCHRPKGQPFKRLGLTLTPKGTWTASVQWEGTTGARGTGKTIAEAIESAIKFVEEKWNGRVET